jgi:hypothetical protein
MNPFQYNILTGIKAAPGKTYSQRKRAVQSARHWVGDRNLTVLGHTGTLALDVVEKVFGETMYPAEDFVQKWLGGVGANLLALMMIPFMLLTFAVSFVVLLPKGYASATLAQKILKGNIKRKQKTRN